MLLQALQEFKWTLGHSHKLLSAILGTRASALAEL